VAAGQLLDILCARSGLVCTIGAGGKKTTLYRLTALHPGRVAMTSTVFIPPFPKDLDAYIVREPACELPAAVVKAAAAHRRIAYTGIVTKKGRFEGVSPALVEEIHTRVGFDVTFIKADGARTRMIKAPAQDEPQLPAGVTTVLPLVSAAAIGRPLSERIGHRIEQIAQVTGARVDTSLTPSHVARLLASEHGLLKGVGNAEVVPIINMVDDVECRRLAQATAREALRLTERFDRVVLASMRAVDPIVDVVSR
jgi:probable selenium-dependent hydroxylase accessory protein YqeC